MGFKYNCTIYSAMNVDIKSNIDDLFITKFIGQGSYGIVYEDNSQNAIKIFYDETHNPQCDRCATNKEKMQSSKFAIIANIGMNFNYVNTVIHY